MPDPTPTSDPNALSLPDFYATLAATGLIERLLVLARDEDLCPSGEDATTAVMGLGEAPIRAAVTFRERAVLAGMAALPDLVRVFGGGIAVEPIAADGDALRAGDAACVLAGPGSRVLTLERTLLNLVGRLSGIATRTAAFVRAVEGTGARICDTRKTTPGLRAFEKYAVRCGGGASHRLSLADAVLIKDNHLAGVGLDELAGVVTEAARKAGMMRTGAGGLSFVEVEVDSLEQLERVLTIEPGLIDYVLLDNFTPGELRDAVAFRARAKSPVAFEASGGVTLGTVRDIAETGVERISVGGLTHQAVSIDVGLDAA